MSRRILFASVSAQEGTPSPEFPFYPGINILWGQSSEDVVLTLAGIFGGNPTKDGKSTIQWHTGDVIFVNVTDGACGVEGTGTQCRNTAQLIKDFHKYRFLNYRNCTHILDCAQLPVGISGASDLLLKKLRAVPAKKDAQPLFLYNFLERLDEAIDLQPLFKALLATGRQVFIAVPHYYEIKTLEEMPYVTIIRTL
jgi:hypothetical protein